MPYDPFTMGGFNSAMVGAAGQNAALNGMTNDVMGAINQENQSRVAQAREDARMQHEKDLEAMRQQTEQAKANALIQRLGQQGGGGSFSPVEGVYFR